MLFSFLLEVASVRLVEIALADEDFMVGVPPMAYWAHAGGFIGGLTIMEVVLRLHKNRRKGESATYVMAGACLVGACYAARHFYADLVGSGAWALLSGAATQGR